MRHTVWVIKTKIWDTVQVIFYYVILYPVIGLVRIENWICERYPEHPDKWPKFWYWAFWITVQIVEPARKFEWDLAYEGLIHIRGW